MSQTDPPGDLVSFLQDNVDTSLISVSFSTSDDIKHADYGRANVYPQIAVVTNDPVVPGGGETGMTAIQADGTGPVQESIETILVDCWGGPPDADSYQGTSEDPDTTAAELRKAVVEACNTNLTSPPAGYQWVTAENLGDADDSERTPTHYRDQVRVRLKQTKTF